MNEYCYIVDKDEEIGVAERIINACPIFTDIDLRSALDEYDEPTPLYTEEDVKSVVRIYYKLFETILPNLEPIDYTCVVLEKSAYMDGNLVKHGFHLHFPYICLTVNSHKNHVMPMVEQKVNEYFRADVFDTGILGSPWLLYGSKKGLNKEPYKVTKIYDHSINIVKPKDAFSAFPLVDCVGKPIDPTLPLSHYYPFLLSTNCQFRKIKDVHIDVMDSNIIRQITEPVFHTIKENYQILSDAQYSINTEKAGHLLPILGDARASNYNDWIRVGWALFNSCGPFVEVLQMWMDFSKRTAHRNYDRQNCIDAWKNMSPGSMTISSLYWMASFDNPEEFSKFIYEEQRSNIFASLSGAHYDIALLLYDEYKDMFRCTSIKEKIWYQFEEHSWKRIESGTKLRNAMSTTLLERFKLARHKLTAQKRIEEDRIKDLGVTGGADLANFKNRIKSIDDMIKKLKTQGFKDSVMRECCEIFYDETFIQKLDMNPYIIGFSNGVYDLKAHTFRCGVPDDYITKVMPINYKEFDSYHPAVQNIHEFLGKIFPDKSIRRHFLDVYCCVFVGGNKDKKFYIWTGEGDNGKSIMYDILEKILGPYSQKPPTSLITGKRTQSAQADPIMSRSQGVRSWMFQETRQADPINCGIVKELTGNDSFVARDLFQKGSDMREITPMFMCGLMCNELPTMYDADKAMWNRVRLFPFESCFVDQNELPTSEDEQLAQKKFLVDRNFKDKIPDMLEPFAWLLLHHLKKTEGVVGIEPFKVKSATDAYRTENNIMEQFIDETMEKRPENKITLSEAYQAFHDWYKSTGVSSDKIMSQRLFKKKMEKHWGEPDRRGVWTGYGFLQEEFDE
ncbi:phage/plasmid primase, P4 family [bacterium]|nr:phage/plasmid primase, P4 family [bacterium]